MAERQHLRALGGAELEHFEEEFIFVGKMLWDRQNPVSSHH